MIALLDIIINDYQQTPSYFTVVLVVHSVVLKCVMFDSSCFVCVVDADFH